MINYYYDDTNELKPYTFALDANEDSIQPDNALRKSPEFKDGYHPCVKGNKWVLIVDNRGDVVYSTKTKEPVTVDYLGEIKKGFTLLEPFEFSVWNGKAWALSEGDKNAATIKANQSIKDALLQEANQQITLLQDAIDLDMAEDGDEAKLKSWKKYRILLNRVDTSQLDIEWPIK